MQLVPEGELRKQLEADFGQMVVAGMFYEEPPKFEQILSRLSEMQLAINKARLTESEGRGRTNAMR